jgi:hypothetical protein
VFSTEICVFGNLKPRKRTVAQEDLTLASRNFELFQDTLPMDLRFAVQRTSEGREDKADVPSVHPSREKTAYWNVHSTSALLKYRKSKVRYRVHKIPPLVTILSQMNPAHILTHSLFRISLICLPNGLLCWRFANKMYAFLTSSRLILRDLMTLTLFGEAWILWSK